MTAIRGVSIQEAQATLGDPLWRLNNLYSIVTKRGEKIAFRPKAAQAKLLRAIYRQHQRRHVVLKARKIGFSTLFELIILDTCFFGEHLQASIVDLTHTHASDKLVNICRFAWENLPAALRGGEPTSDSRKELGWANDSIICAGKSARGGVNQLLHVSEWGPIAYEDPKRSEEIKTGALPSADAGVVLVESTFKGGKGGHFYDLIKRSMETPAEERTDKDFVFHFFPWYEDPEAVLDGDPKWISADCRKYLDEKEAELAIKFRPQQRVWYFKTAAEQGIFMWREYPTTVDEAFSAPVEGAIYGAVISRIRARGQIRPFEWDRSRPVFASWDIGFRDSMAVWLFQLTGPDVQWPFHVERHHVTAAEMMDVLRQAEIPIALHLLPHDAGSQRPGDGATVEDMLRKAGAVNTRVLPRPRSVWPGIDAARAILQRSWFAKGPTDAGIAALEAYHTRSEVEQGGGVLSSEPVHDWASHTADALRVGCEAIELGLAVQPRTRKGRVIPRAPDGSIVDLEQVREMTRRRGSGLAISAEPW